MCVGCRWAAIGRVLAFAADAVRQTRFRRTDWEAFKGDSCVATPRARHRTQGAACRFYDNISRMHCYEFENPTTSLSFFDSPGCATDIRAVVLLFYQVYAWRRTIGKSTGRTFKTGCSSLCWDGLGRFKNCLVSVTRYYWHGGAFLGMQNGFTGRAMLISGVAVGRASHICLYTKLRIFAWFLVGVQPVLR
eukprot:6203202-Pleurochrysis_carterae.AAC.2